MAHPRVGAGPWPGGQGWMGEAVGSRFWGSVPGPDCRRFIRPDHPRAQGQPLVYQLNLGLAVAQRGLEIFSSETALLTVQHTQAREAELIAWHSRPITPARGLSTAAGRGPELSPGLRAPRAQDLVHVGVWRGFSVSVLPISLGLPRTAPPQPD